MVEARELKKEAAINTEARKNKKQFENELQKKQRAEQHV
jgi:hypothetical protein